jgi:predicted amidohydrolase YtcJ
MEKDKILIAQQPNFTYNQEERYRETLEGKRLATNNAITMYTRNGAFLTREEKIKGTIEPGKLADLIVLPQDLLSISPDKLLTRESGHDHCWRPRPL